MFGRIYSLLLCDKQTQWVKWFPLAEWWYNTSFHTTTKMTPFMALYGYQPPSITSYLRENSKVQGVEHHIEHQQQVLQLLKKVIGDRLPVQTIVPELDEEGKIILELEQSQKQ